MNRNVILGKSPLSTEMLVSVARGNAHVDFSEDYCRRTEKCRALIEKWVNEERVIYGTTTGFGSLVSQKISPDDAQTLQRNIILTHSTSVGQPMDAEDVRATMLMILQSLGFGVSGVQLSTLEFYREMLNRGVVPVAPAHGSVGYLCIEAHIAMVAIGGGKAWYQGELLDGGEALKRAGLQPIEPSYKEGLALVSGITSCAALAGLAVHDFINCVKAADVIAAVSFEALGGLTAAFDSRVMDLHPHPEQRATAENLLRLLEGSQIIEKSKGSHLQDALSLRCIPQAHGAAKKLLCDAKEAVERELNSCCDNPVFFAEGDDGCAISNGNPDASFSGMEMDACCIAATYLAKMSERRNTRFIDTNLSGFPSYLVGKPGLNSGLMIPQYSQAGLLNEMRILSTSSVIDNVTTSGNQEDYVTMGYNACFKAKKVAELLEYVLSIELLSAYQAQQFMDEKLCRGNGTQRVLSLIGKHIPMIREDEYLYPHIEKLRELIHSGAIVRAAEDSCGTLQLN